ncbi:MAG: glycosyltransferase family 2 protein [Alphaproteobacteria bacterium]|nr:glycosyltransferase family 2 protein [Alphaproteobacteria bacterium]
MNMPKVSVILPCYNVANYMDAMFESLRNQTMKDIEIICVDDKSTDNTVKKIREFMKSDKRISLYKLAKNHGASYARNYGLKKAKGKYVCFLDPDDYIDNDFIEKLYKTITKTKFDVAKAKFKVGDKYWQTHEFVKRNYLCFSSEHCSAMYNKKFLLENNILYPEDVITGEDAVFLSNLVLHTNKITTTDDTYYHYVRREKSLDSEKLSHKQVLARIKMLDYKIQMLKEHKFNTYEDKIIFIQRHILNHFCYAVDPKRISESDKNLLFKWFINNRKSFIA